MAQPIRVLVAKPGLDGHDRGALVIAQGLRDEGFEVIYTGLRQTPLQIVATAIQEDVACIGLSSLSGAHMELFPEVVRLLRERQAEDILVIGGGVVPDEDRKALLEQGIAEVFTPGTKIQEVAEFIRSHVRFDSLGEDTEVGLTNKVDHVAIAVPRIADALPFYTQVLKLSVVHEEVIHDQQVKAVFVKAGDVHIELLEPTAESSPIAKFVQQKGGGLHHIAYEVKDAADALAAAEQAGFRLIDKKPRFGGRGKLIGFVHPKDTNGVLVEFCQLTTEEVHAP
ncbi:methylmalonyl-CoA epimerase [Alicyclobacillus sp. SO9]|uniref:methylmalonyl-CoA epimerase n=1 Tax=Alicyclobacillus sp. SO9 TaxID=2665646 RepID=UPI0018E73264|nr:methylmalonyl-CoA epimerase [Alicyclobacillus sp. SO9]QQE76923.1 methylmalonyl-CoA epimerase [Alicyclobacillus sp. SO9]